MRMLSGNYDRPELVAVVGLEHELYRAIVEELHDMPDLWPQWVRDMHKANALALASRARAEAQHGLLLWRHGRELAGAIEITDARTKMQQARRMLSEVGLR